MQSADALIPVLRTHLERERGIGFAYLFGSVAKNRAQSGSDLDIAVWFDASRPEPDSWATRATELAAVLEDALHLPVDVVELNTAPAALRHNVLSHGRLVMSRDDVARRNFYVRHAQEWYDLEPARELFARAMLHRITEGDFGRARHSS